MPIVRGKQRVAEVYQRAADDRWVVPTFCAENQTTIEAILAACQHKAAQLARRVPITIAITGRYPHRPQAQWYAASRDPEVGLALFLGDVETLADPKGAYPDVDVLVHLDHGQPDLDAFEHLDRFSSVMYDASALPWQRNLELTAAFVAAHGDQVLIEGAADEIVDAGGAKRADLTTPGRAEEFVRVTGVDMVVANLGTEHRAGAAELCYHPEAARAIGARIGARLVLHGASSVPPAQLATLFADGVCKVNIWTILERDSAVALLRDMVANAVAIAGRQPAADLVAQGLLGPAALRDGGPDISRFTSAWRNQIIHDQMRAIVANYLDMWYR